MRFQVLFSVSLAALVSAFPQSSSIDWSKHKWQAPGPNDLRSPCPGLNTLANHGFIPRDGRGLTARNVLQGAIDGFNVQNDVLAIAVKLGQLTTDAIYDFTLDDLKRHNTLEHDASLSRSDFALGDNLHFNETIFQTLANSNPGVDYYNATSAGQVMKQRLADDTIANPNITNTAKELGLRIGESLLYLSVIGGAGVGVAPKKFVDIFFREERMPIAEGWKRSALPINNPSFANMSAIIFQEAQWAPGPVLECASIDLVVDATSILHI